MDLAPPVIKESPADTDADSGHSYSTNTNYDVSEEEGSAWASYGANEGSQGSSTGEDEAAIWAACVMGSYSKDDEEVEDVLGAGSYLMLLKSDWYDLHIIGAYICIVEQLTTNRTIRCGRY